MGENSMCTISVPYFKDMLIMAFSCPHCGAKNNEVKSNGEISEMGKMIKLAANCEDDLKRDLFKSETAAVIIPELELELSYGTLGGVYTTVEGVLEKILYHLDSNVFKILILLEEPFCWRQRHGFQEEDGKATE
jgi:zinc finger protein